MKQSSRKSELKNLLMILASSMLAGLVLTIGFLWFLNPDGRVYVQDALLSPVSLDALSKKNSSGLLFKAVEFNGKAIGMQNYSTLYDQIKGDRSLKGSDEKMFFEEKPLTLQIQMTSQTFQTAEFLDDDYRISLRQEGDQTWAYFHHEGIGKIVKELTQP